MMLWGTNAHYPQSTEPHVHLCVGTLGVNFVHESAVYKTSFSSIFPFCVILTLIISSRRKLLVIVAVISLNVLLLKEKNTVKHENDILVSDITKHYNMVKLTICTTLKTQRGNKGSRCC